MPKGDNLKDTAQDDGSYTLPLLPPGDYDLSVEAKGFPAGSYFWPPFNRRASVALRRKYGGGSGAKRDYCDSAASHGAGGAGAASEHGQ